jgi:hypothetical protein
VVPDETIRRMGIFRNTWQDIRGNLKYDILKWVVLAGVAVLTAAAIKWIQQLRHAPQQDTLGYILLAVLIFVALMTCGISAVLGAGGISARSTKVRIGVREPGMALSRR